MMSSADIDLSSVPIRALSLSTRHRLSEYLNVEQYITTSSGLSRDYRGIAQMMGFSYAIMDSTLRTSDSFNHLLSLYQNRSDATLQSLLLMLEKIERFDVIDDMTPILLKDADYYIKRYKSQNSDQSMPSIESPIISEVVLYDAYVCYADNDKQFVEQLSNFLEGQNGFRLFIRERDMCLGSWVYESFAQIVNTQCRKVLIILSPDFMSCEECQFQTMFSTALAIEQKSRKLIPIVYKSCEIPPIISMLSKLDCRGAVIQDWTLNRLVESIRSDGTNNSILYRQRSANKPLLLQLPSVGSNSSSDSPFNSITSIDEALMRLPSVCPTPTAPPISTQTSICSINSDISEKSFNCESLPILNSQKDKISKKSNHKKWNVIQTFRQKFKN